MTDLSFGNSPILTPRNSHIADDRIDTPLKTLSMTKNQQFASPAPSAGSIPKPRINLKFSVVDTASPTVSPTSGRGPQTDDRPCMGNTPGSPLRHAMKINEELDDDESNLLSAHSDQLSSDFRLLASKEMEILETKNTIKELVRKQRGLEKEIKGLKVGIERQLVKNATQEAAKVHRERQQAIQRMQKMQALQNQNTHPSQATRKGPPPSHRRPGRVSPPAQLSSDQSWLTRPMNLIQHFDDLISEEFDKLELGNEADRLEEEKYNDTLRRKREINQPIKQLADGGDVVQSVSQHLWSFVNEVKANLLVEDPADELALLGIHAKLPPPKKVGSPLTTHLLDNDEIGQVDESDLWDAEEDLLEL